MLWHKKENGSLPGQECTSNLPDTYIVNKLVATNVHQKRTESALTGRSEISKCCIFIWHQRVIIRQLLVENFRLTEVHGTEAVGSVSGATISKGNPSTSRDHCSWLIFVGYQNLPCGGKPFPGPLLFATDLTELILYNCLLNKRILYEGRKVELFAVIVYDY